MVKRFLFFVLLGATAAVQAQQVLNGNVTDTAGVALPGLRVSAGNRETHTDLQGRFRIKLDYPAQLEIEGISIQSASYWMGRADSCNPCSFQVLPKTIISKEVTVRTGRVQSVHSRLQTPRAGFSLQPALLRDGGANNLFDVITQVPGIRPQMACNVCNTAEIRTAGMEGPYTLVSLDGIPMIGGLSSVYGLNSFPLSMASQINVEKGGADPAIGTDAVAGTIDIQTPLPTAFDHPVFRLQLSSLGDMHLEGLVAGKRNILALNLTRNWARIDANKDGFTDFALVNRGSVFFKRVARILPEQRFFTVRLYAEDRFGGQMNWTPAFRQGDSIYGESIRILRGEIAGRWDSKDQRLQLRGAWVTHWQDAVYGANLFLAQQHNLFLSGAYRLYKTKQQEWTAGSGFRLNMYNDNTSIATAEQNYGMGGLFVRHRLDRKKISWDLSLRTDYHARYGIIPAPRAALLWKFLPWLKFNVYSSRGFRIANLFTEEHGALSGSRTVVLPPGLKPEHTWFNGAGLQMEKQLRTWRISLGLDGFANFVEDKIITDYFTDPEKIFVYNVDEPARYLGLTLVPGIIYKNKWLLEGNLNYLHCRFKAVGGSWEPIAYTPEWSGWLRLARKNLPYQINAWYECSFTGRMLQPVFDKDPRPAYSPAFALHQVGLEKSWKEHWSISVTLHNLLNYFPKYGLMRPYDPFDKTPSADGTSFDTAYNYAPFRGRYLMLTLSWK